MAVSMASTSAAAIAILASSGHKINIKGRWLPYFVPQRGHKTAISGNCSMQQGRAGAGQPDNDNGRQQFFFRYFRMF